MSLLNVQIFLLCFLSGSFVPVISDPRSHFVSSFVESFLPGPEVEKCQDRHDFKSSRQHIKYHDYFGQIGKSTVISDRPYHIQTGSYIVEGRGNGRYIRFKIKSVCRYDQKRSQKNGSLCSICNGCI